jgi:hypothetical protein
MSSSQQSGGANAGGEKPKPLPTQADPRLVLIVERGLKPGETKTR